jgi:hypothetical protein
MPTNQADLLAGLSPAEQRLVLLIERRLEERIYRRLDGKVAAIRKGIDRIIIEGELESAVAYEYPDFDDEDDDDEDNDDEHPAEGA